MPLSDPTPRESLHQRRITVCGYRRDDGLFDIEAHLADTKSYGFGNSDRGWIAPGEKLHEMRARLTIDEDLRVVAAEAITEHGPYAICPGGAATFGRLAGLTIKPGFLRAANERLAGIAGCTHLRELLQQMATTAFQTLYPVRAKRDEAAAVSGTAPPSSGAARLIDTCYAYARDGDVVRRRWPELATEVGQAGSPN